MRLGYGTYGMPEVPPAEAVRRLRTIGYEAIELAAEPGWSTDPNLLDRSARIELREELHAAGYDRPSYLALLRPGEPDVPLEDTADRIKRIGELAADLAPAAPDEPFVLTTTLGNPGTWKSSGERVVEMLLELADVCATVDLVLAVEPHVGGVLDTPEKARWLIERCAHDRVRLNFDISHFQVAGISMSTSVPACLAYAAHLHVKDGWMADGQVHFCLPGEGSIDWVHYMKLVSPLAERLAAIVEVSGMVRRRAGYDPWHAAATTYTVLDRARHEAIYG